MFAEVPLVVLAYVVHVALDPRYMADFHVFWQAGRDFASGSSPYPPLDAAVLAAGHSFVYPAPAALALVPLGALPSGIAAVVFMAMLVLSVPLALLALGVRDWRCYGVAFLPAPVLAVLGSGALTLFLVLGLALAWRYRDRTRIAAALVAALIVAKLLLWPVVVWLLATRRWRTAAYAAVGAVVVTLASWSLIGFAGLEEYPRLLRMLADVERGDGYSLIALALALGLPEAFAGAATILGAATAVGAIVFVAGRGEGDRDAFIVAIGAALLLSPIVWLHYFALLLVPIALARRRLSPLWFAPIALWIVPMHSGGSAARIAFAAALAGIVVGACLGAWTPRRQEKPATAVAAS